ncbi:polyketide synthase [Fusarium pseudoanthophilum]|uniref:Polyketide synthase n=1 Tax=Fusarium pseudoanthophilum TaxID=48495 RepID=A0A8H5KJE7_9HYPO|nr:polyketide synthase [Fusarium pseudoanthophilum]
MEKKRLFLKRLHRDVQFLQKLQIMDYSLLIGIHDLKRSNENLRDKTLKACNSGGYLLPDDQQSVLIKAASNLENTQKTREFRQVIKAVRPVPMGQTSTRIPSELVEGQNTECFLFYKNDGGFGPVHDKGHPGEEIYYLGLIDCLTNYGISKKIEHFWKGLWHDRTQISAIPPQEYGERFLRFMEGITIVPEEATCIASGKKVVAAAAEQERGHRALFHWRADPLEGLMADNILMRMYEFTNNTDHLHFLTLLGHKKPTMRVLEIGAGTGGTTATILPALKSDQGERMYGTYVYSDISAGFFVGAKERFRDYHAIEYSVLDITQDPISQGFEEGSFDLIVSSNCLHATPDLAKTLSNVRKLLHPEGRLFLMELSPESSKSVNYVMGPLVGWWLSEDGRENEPYVSVGIWHEKLLQAGFSGVEAYAFDGNMSNSIIARPVQPRCEQLKRVSIIANELDHPVVAEVTKYLQGKGLDLDLFSLGQVLTPGQPAVFLMDLEATFLANITEEQFNSFKRTLFSVQDVPFCWVTGACQIGCKNPDYALVNGMARSIRQETGIDLVTFELEVFDASAWKALSDLLETFPSRVTDGEVDTDFESDELQDKGPKPSLETEDVSGLEGGGLGTGGHSSSRAQLQGTRHPAKPSQVTSYLTLNIGLLELPWVLSRPPTTVWLPATFDFEGAGVVTWVGSGVQHLVVGDRVAFSSTGCFYTSQTMPEIYCTKIHDSLTFEEAATMPCVFGTAMYGLVDLARLEAEQSVLIHSACGGVGQAAIQIAKMIGAEVRTPSTSNDSQKNAH